MNSVYISPGIYIHEIDKSASSNKKTFSLSSVKSRKGSEGGSGETTGNDTYLRSIAYTDVDCVWAEDENKMLLNFYNMSGQKMTVIYLFDTDSEGDIVFDAGNFV